jgi:hypothetical protein
MLRAIAPVIAVLLAAPTLAAEAEPDDSMLGFVVGDYVVIGRDPDSGAVYSGSARIGLADIGPAGGLVLERRVGEHPITARGGFEVPSPPGEGRVLRFRWQEPAPIVMTCIVGSDLDNYARLTCIWLREGSEPATPGLEAMFPTASKPGARPLRNAHPPHSPAHIALAPGESWQVQATPPQAPIVRHPVGPQPAKTLSLRLVGQLALASVGLRLALSLQSGERSLPGSLSLRG